MSERGNGTDDTSTDDQELERERVGTTWGNEASVEADARRYRELVRGVVKARRRELERSKGAA